MRRWSHESGSNRRSTRPPDQRREAVSDVVRAFPWWSDAWAELGDLARDDVEAYACFRVGYHRGLDALSAVGVARKSGTCAGASRRTGASCDA